jgi:FAD/FMN-containing dehydrogenase
VLLDAPAELRAAVDPWGVDGPAVALARRVKQRFDPAGVCNPGIHVGGI